MNEIEESVIATAVVLRSIEVKSDRVVSADVVVLVSMMPVAESTEVKTSSVVSEIVLVLGGKIWGGLAVASSCPSLTVDIIERKYGRFSYSLSPYWPGFARFVCSIRTKAVLLGGSEREPTMSKKKVRTPKLYFGTMLTDFRDRITALLEIGD